MGFLMSALACLWLSVFNSCLAIVLVRLYGHNLSFEQIFKDKTLIGIHDNFASYSSVSWLPLSGKPVDLGYSAV